MPKKNVPKKQWSQRKRNLLKTMGKKRITQTKMQRRQAMEKFHAKYGYYPARLSQVVGVGNPSRYTVKKREVRYRVEKEWRPGEKRLTSNRIRRYLESEPNYEFFPGREVVVRKTPVGERLVIKKLHKKSGAGKGGGSGERASHKTGSAKAKTSRAKAAKRGMRAGREKRKQKKKR